MIVIPHNGPILPKGGIYGPITSPYMEDIATIGLLVMRNYRIDEVLADGTHIELTPSNFDKEHTKKTEVVPVEEKQTVDVIDVVDPVIQVDESDKVEESVEVPTAPKQQFNKKHNKQRNQQQPSEVLADDEIVK